MLRVLGREGLVRDLLAGDSRHDTGGGGCLPTELLVRGWGWRGLLAINQQVQGLGKAACWCALTAGFGKGGFRGGLLKRNLQTRIRSLLAERLSVQG